ncbi:MAG: hypothetical protein R3327_02830 [Nitrosopumilaceae archaeon]|nr:hypothetical protein [Nitrosopumilaceae archaeon]
MRRFEIRLNDHDYVRFEQICGEYGLTVEEKLYEIIQFYLKVRENRIKKMNLDEFL